MAARISATEAAHKFSDLINKVRRGETFEVVRDGEVVARLVPAGTVQGEPTLRNLLQRLDAPARPDDEFASDLESIQRERRFRAKIRGLLDRSQHLHRVGAQ